MCRPCQSSLRVDKNERARTLSAPSIFILWLSWKWEIVACMLIFASPFAIVATVYPHMARPLPHWPLGISVNAILSVYSTLLKGNLAFVTSPCIGQLGWIWFSSARPLYDFVRYDRAGRDVWGPLRLLWAQRFKHRLTIMAGAILILSMFVDISIQLLIGQSDCSATFQHEKAILPRTNQFDDKNDTPGFGEDLALAVSRGIQEFGGGSEATCSTGNCTFAETYGTIGYCSSCQDSSADMIITTACYPGSVLNKSISLPTDCPINSTFTITTSLPLESYHANSSEPSQLNVTYSLNISALSSEWNFDNLIGLEVSKIGVLRSDIKTPERIVVKVLAGKTSFSDRHLDVSTGQTLTDCGGEEPTDSWHCRGYGAATCTIQPCARIFNATVEIGHLTERVISDSGLISWATDPIANSGLGIVDTQCLTKQQKETLARQGYVINETNRWLPYNATTYPGANSSTVDLSMTSTLLAQKCLYFIATGFNSSIAPSILSAHFTGAVQAHGSHQGSNPLESFSISDFAGNPTLEYIYNSGHTDFARIESTFANISESLTSYVRTHGSAAYSEPATGQVSHFATCLRVNWPWLAFPSSIAILTLVLFAMTVHQTAVQRIPIWKTSLLPWIVCLLGSHQDTSQDQFNGILNRIDKMEDLSKRIMATVDPMPNATIRISISGLKQVDKVIGGTRGCGQ
ncbi:hypothetical protein F5Y19DRAFT_10849 [Xylariaceae sp. FL1651]|nr:hypothetical protein F5Y19DRAFT_10849 [Xylariaceae sp. FL1651]